MMMIELTYKVKKQNTVITINGVSHAGTERMEHIHILITSTHKTDNMIPKGSGCVP